MQKLHVILSCTARKRGSEPGYPRLRSVAPVPVSNRVEQWAALVSAASRRFVAADMYAGEYWRTAMELASRAAFVGHTRVCVVSAGLGLVGIHDKVPKYGATLAAGHPDSVLASLSSATPSQVRRQWWEELTRADVMGRHGPRPLVELDECGSGAVVMVCLGRSYLDAVTSDLISLVERLGDPERIMVFASGPPRAGLEESWVPVAGSLRLTLGGSLSSTSLRSAVAVLAELGTSSPSVDRARSIVTKLTAKAGDLPSFDRRRRSDEFILDWILDHLAKSPNATRTAALRCFRDGGSACEQARFARLFDQAREWATRTSRCCWRTTLSTGMSASGRGDAVLLSRQPRPGGS